jgi:hypothetical protein
LNVLQYHQNYQMAEFIHRDMQFHWYRSADWPTLDDALYLALSQHPLSALMIRQIRIEVLETISQFTENQGLRKPRVKKIKRNFNQHLFELRWKLWGNVDARSLRLYYSVVFVEEAWAVGFAFQLKNRSLSSEESRLEQNIFIDFVLELYEFGKAGLWQIP